MAMIFDVVRVTERGANTSDAPGRWLFRIFHHASLAEEYARRCNNSCHINGVQHVVEGRDELDPARPICYGDFLRQCRKEGRDATRIAGTPEADAVIARFIGENS